MTLRENTERSVTIVEGTNQLVKSEIKSIVGAVNEILDGNVKKGRVPKFWDGKTAERIVEVFDGWFGKNVSGSDEQLISR